MTAEGKTVGVGIIGAGGRGVYCVGTRMAEMAPEQQLVVKAVCDRNADRMKEGKAHLEKQFAEREVKTEIRLIPDYRDLIADPRVDLVMVSTTCDAHRDPALAALASGKKVYLDKPIAADLDDSIAIIEGQRKHKNTLMMGFSRRYEPAWRKAHELLDDGVIGDLYMMQIRAVIPYWRYFQGWWRRRKWSGGALNDKSSHHYDVLNWFAHSRCEKISAFGGGRTSSSRIRTVPNAAWSATVNARTGIRWRRETSRRTTSLSEADHGSTKPRKSTVTTTASVCPERTSTTTSSASWPTRTASRPPCSGPSSGPSRKTARPWSWWARRGG